MDLSPVLVDKSAFVRGAEAPGELCLCAITRLELLYSARSERDYAEIETLLAEFRDLRMNRETFAVAAGAQRELASCGHHRVPLPDLLIAGCAQQHHASVLHLDRHFDVLAEVLDFTPVRAE